MTYAKIALVLALAAGVAAPADAATTTFTGRGQSINLRQLSAENVTLESVVYDITYTAFATYLNPVRTDQQVSFSGAAGTNEFGYVSFSSLNLVSGETREANLSAMVKSSGTFTADRLSPFIGDNNLTIFPTGAFSSGLGTSPIRGGIFVDYAITYTYSVIPTVPEPTTWALMLAGFALTGYALRRRRANVAFA